MNSPWHYNIYIYASKRSRRLASLRARKPAYGRPQCIIMEYGLLSLTISEYIPLLVIVCHRLFTHHCLSLPERASIVSISYFRHVFHPDVHRSQVKVHLGVHACGFRSVFGFVHIQYAHTHTHTHNRL